MSRYSAIDFNDQLQLDSDILHASLKEDPTWGLVIIRCSYESQEKWDVFLDITKQRVTHQLKEEAEEGDNAGDRAAEIAERLRWTTIEDRAVLDGASLEQTCRFFMQWSETEGWRKMEGRSLEEEGVVALDYPWIPQYRYFIHADAAMIQSVYEDWQAFDNVGEDGGYQWAGGKNHFYLIDAASLFEEEDFSVVAEWEEEAEAEEARRVKGATLLELYVHLLTQRHMLMGEDGLWVLP